MPVVFDMFGYKFYFWSKEFINGTDKLEPVHIHVCKGVPSQHAPKWWVGPSGILVSENNPRLSDYDISNSDIAKIEKSILANRDRIIARWIAHFVGYDIDFMNETK
jgi:hypothetical protein